MRLVFMGTPAFAVPTLMDIIANGYEVAGVYTRPPHASGRRNLKILPSPVEEIAKKFSIPVLTPQNFQNPFDVETFQHLGADVGVVVAYGLILPPAILQAPRYGCLNLHASLLPRWRGAAPIQRAIMAKDTETGVMVMRMEEGLDTGPIALSERVAIHGEATAGDLHDLLAREGADLMIRALAALFRENLHFQPQSQEGVTYAHKISKKEAQIDWHRSAEDLRAHIHGLSPFPSAFFETDVGHGPERVKILRARLHPLPTHLSYVPGTFIPPYSIACGHHALELVQVQRAGRHPLPAEEFFKGMRWREGQHV